MIMRDFFPLCYSMLLVWHCFRSVILPTVNPGEQRAGEQTHLWNATVSAGWAFTSICIAICSQLYNIYWLDILVTCVAIFRTRKTNHRKVITPPHTSYLHIHTFFSSLTPLNVTRWQGKTLVLIIALRFKQVLYNYSLMNWDKVS